MRLRFSVRTAVLGVAAIALFSAYFATAWRSSRNRIVVRNHSGVGVKSLSLRLGEHSIRFGSIPREGTSEALFPIHGHDGFKVTGKLADGTLLGGTFDYATNSGHGLNARLTVEPGGSLRFND